MTARWPGCTTRCAPRSGPPPAGAEPTAAIIDSQSVRAADTVPRTTRGWDNAKKVNGRKRHIAVDTMGLLLAVVITAASVQDRDAARPLLWNLHRTSRRIRLIWADAVYTGKLARWAAAMKINLQIVPQAPRTPSRSCPAAGSWKEPSPGSASTAAPSATTNASRPATKP